MFVIQIFTDCRPNSLNIITVGDIESVKYFCFFFLRKLCNYEYIFYGYKILKMYEY